MKTTFIGVVVAAAALGALAFFGATPFVKTVQYVQGFGSATGATFNSAKVAAIVMSPTSNSASTSAILNSDASDRIITDNFVQCSGATTTAFAQNSAGLAVWRWAAATSTTAGVQASVIGYTGDAMNITVATGTYDTYTASSTYANKSSMRWPAGSYLLFQVNGTTTPSISCVAGVHYLGS